MMNEEIVIDPTTAQWIPKEPTLSPLKIARPFSKSSYLSWEESEHNAAGGLYSNGTVGNDESNETPLNHQVTYQLSENNSTSTGNSGTFGRLVRTTVGKTVAHEKRSKAPVISLNLHRFQTECGDSLGDDPDVWARLTF